MPNSPAQPARRTLNPLDRFAKNRKDGVVTDAELVTPTLKRVRITCDRLEDMTFTPGQHFRIEINDPLSLYGIFRPGETLRTYSIWDYDPGTVTFEIRGHLYEGDGIGLRWLHDVKKGDTVPFWGPLGDLVLRPGAPYHLFAGDETAEAGVGALAPGVEPPLRGLWVVGFD
ncbi:siderophore-interacting protein, partial [Streptomyces sp. NPDC058953]|uniref:siderophore-interacting protein n=1 Tax=Streptomyces sp. NPDC058953 TaxID=3346676 RepID=UPI0036CE9214